MCVGVCGVCVEECVVCVCAHLEMQLNRAHLEQQLPRETFEKALHLRDWFVTYRYLSLLIYTCFWSVTLIGVIVGSLISISFFP